MALILAPVIKENGNVVSKTILLSNKKVASGFYQNSDSKTVFNVFKEAGRQDKTTEFVYDGTLAAFQTLLDEADVNDYIPITGDGSANNLQERYPNKRYYQDHVVGVSGVVQMHTDDIFEGEDLAVGSVIKYMRGNFEEIHLKNPLCGRFFRPFS